MMENEQKEKIAIWLSKNLNERVKGNKYLSDEQIKEISDKLTELIALNETDADQESIIERGNSTIELMNEMMNEKRVSEIPSLEDFKEFLAKGNDELEQSNACKNIMSMFDILFAANKYDLAADYIDVVPFDSIKHDGIPLWVMVSTNPIQPLLRPIPKVERLTKLNIVRSGFYEKACAFYEKVGKDYFKDGRHKPADYDKQLSEYNILYGGKAPQEK